MAYFRLIKDHAPGHLNLNQIQQISDLLERQPGMYTTWASNNLIGIDAVSVLTQLQAVWKAYNKSELMFLTHFVLSLSPDTESDIHEIDLMNLGQEALHIFSESQVLFAVVTDGKKCELHFLINPIELYSGAVANPEKLYVVFWHFIEDRLSKPAYWNGRRPLQLVKEPYISALTDLYGSEVLD